MFNAKNSKKQGDIGLGSAISWFVANGYTVCIPLTDSQDYDLVVEFNNKLKRVQVKTTTHIKKSGNYAVGLRVSGGNRSWNGIPKKFDPNRFDLLFILLENGDRYLIPSYEIKIVSELTLSEIWKHRKL